MARGRGRGRGTRKGKGKGKGRNKRQESHSSSPERTPPPEDADENTPRRSLKWLHAGVYLDPESEVQNIWYAFKQLKNGGYRIIYSRDRKGTSLGNLNVGQIKRNLITFDGHHSRQWRHFLDRSGTWAYRKAKIGRHCQRKVLLETFLDPSFVDPYPEGRPNQAIGPRLNVIHYDNSGELRTARGSSRRSRTVTPPGPEDCYPDTSIPLSTEDIKIGAFRHRSQDAIQVIHDFLTGRMNTHSSSRGNRSVQVDIIESAFYDQGWRVDRAAVEQALQDMVELGSTAFDSNAFIQNLPIRVDNFKGDEVESLMKQVGGKDPTRGSNSDNDSNDDSDDESDDDLDGGLFVGRNKKERRAKAAPQPRDELLTKQLARYMAGRKAAQATRTSDEDDFEFLPDDSPLKGKGKALRKHAREDGTNNQDNDYIEIDEERSVPAKRIKSEAPVFQNNWDNPIVIDGDSTFENDSDIEIIEELSCPKGRMKQEDSDGIIVLDADDD